MTFAERLAATCDDGPLDGTRLQKDIAGMGINATVRAGEFHDQLKRRIRDRLGK